MEPNDREEDNTRGVEQKSRFLAGSTIRINQ